MELRMQVIRLVRLNGRIAEIFKKWLEIIFHGIDLKSMASNGKST